MSSRVVVIAYHAVGPCDRADDRDNLYVSTERFADHMEFLASHRRVITLEQAVQAPPEPGPPAVAITFDDGYRSVLQHAVPILEAHGFPATMFVPTKWIGDRNRWDAPIPCSLDIMAVDELREADARGLEIESHGHAHLDLTDAGEADATADVGESLDVLEGITGRRPRFLAYPFSHGSSGAQWAAESLGLIAAFSIDRPGTGRFDAARVPITPYDQRSMFRVKTSGRYLAARFSLAGRAATAVTEPIRRAHRAAGA
jgi:peptidoglycan/xylan/chitin deacetylase (PgdA/CDA1 family)